ncbi:MAG TPA: sulfatase-like hydrolase/transferase [Caldilineaceae bacterium]|nr:sulfatase-like hydrolase/transferase [Caldilineaceae bacterium]
MSSKLTRRDFIRTSGAAAAAGAIFGATAGAGLAQENIYLPIVANESSTIPGATPTPTPTAIPVANADSKNILFITVDQERYPIMHVDENGVEQWPVGFDPAVELPAHTWIRQNGVNFTQHHVCSAPCTPSRAIIYTGMHVPNNGMRDNTNIPTGHDMDCEIDTVGDMLREVGYYTAYKGKWHLAETANCRDTSDTTVNALEVYGFSDYNPNGDRHRELEGYSTDDDTARESADWLANKAPTLDKPWFFAVNFVNPHDVMYYDADNEPDGGPMNPGENSRFSTNIDPSGPEDATDYPTDNNVTDIYRDADGNLIQWDPGLPRSFYADLGLNPDGSGEVDTENWLADRPAAQREFMQLYDYLMGEMHKDQPALYKNRVNYYLNCLRNVDRHIQRVLDALESSGQMEKTIILFTADHGEMCGAHALTQKGNFIYRENIGVPLVMIGLGNAGTENAELTSSVDLAPTILSLAGVGDWQSRWSQLVGHDLSPLATDPTGTGPRGNQATPGKGMLFTYDSISTLDAAFSTGQSNVFNLAKRGLVRGIFDGRYKMTRYFSPLNYHRPADVTELRAKNDIELYDTLEDPDEINNLIPQNPATPLAPAIQQLLSAMNDKLNALAEAEIGPLENETGGLPLPIGKSVS